MSIQVITEQISRDALAKAAQDTFGDFVKVVVDVEKEIMALGGEWHVDCAAVLVERGSRAEDIWGVRLYPAQYGGEWIEFDSQINMRPRQGKHSRTIEDARLRKQIQTTIEQLIK